MKVYQNYHCHKYYSNIFTPDSPSSLKEYVKQIKEYGHKVLSSVEHGFQGNYFYAYQLAKENDLKFIFGTEAYWVKDRLGEYPEIDEKTGEYKKEPKTGEIKLYKDSSNCHIIILAKSEIGRKAINKILSTANEDGYYYKPRLDLSLIFSLPKDDVFITSACFTEDMKVKTDKGYKKIIDLNIDDLVLTHKSTWEKVNRKTTRKYNDVLYYLDIEGCFNEIKCTKDHRFPTVQKTHNNVTKEIIWKKAEELNLQDRILSVVDSEVVNVEKIDFSKEINELNIKNRKNRKHIKSKILEVNNHLLELLGIYTAEGSFMYNNYGIRFTLNKEDEIIINKVKKYMTEIFGVEPYIKDKHPYKAIDLEYLSTEIHAVFKKWFDQGANNKNIPEFINKLSPDKQMQYVKGLFNGDGHITKDMSRITYNTISDNLMYNVIDILDRNNIKYSTYTTLEKTDKNNVHHCKAYILDINVKPFIKYWLSFRNTDEEYKFDAKAEVKWNSKKWVNINGINYVHKPIKNIRTQKYSGKVFCLDVNNYHSFKVESISTHNCIAGWKYEDMDDIVLQLHDYFGDNFMLEAQYHNTQSQKDLNRHILDLSKQYNINIIAGMDSHYNKDEEDLKRRDDILEYKKTKYDNEEDWFHDYPDYDTAFNRFKEQGILSDKEINVALDNTNILLDFDDYDNEYVFSTDIKLPTIYPELTQGEKNNKLKSILNNEWVKYKKEENIKSIEVHNYIKGIQEEYEEIEKTNMADYFLFNYEMIKLGKQKGGLITKRGRGSAPSFFMNTLLGFSKVDRFKTPIKLYPERFLTADRILQSKSLPDIDFNLYDVDKFAEAQREIIGYHCAYPMIAFGTLQKSAAFKLYAGAKGVEPALANEITKQLKKYEKALKYAEEDEKDDILLEDYVDEKYIPYIEASVEYQGIVVSKSQHPCAWILLNKDIREEIGILRCESESTGKSVLVACIDGAMAEYYKFLKNDLLKVDVVGLTTKIWNRIGIPEPTNNQLEKMIKGDKETWDIYTKGLTMCINQVEKDKTKKKAMRYKISSTAELSAFVAAVRPAFASLLDNFLDRKFYTNGVKELDDVLSDSFHYMLYQESIMAYLNWLGINNKETYDILKKIAKKKFKGDELIKLKSKLHENWIKNVRIEEGFEESWKVVEDASAYAFNCSHSYCVGNDGVEIAYTKGHYPYETYEVCLNEYDRKKNKDKLMLLKQEMLVGFGIEEGRYKFGLDNRRFTLDKENHCINPSLSSIKGIGLKIAEKLYELGQNKYNDFIDILTTLRNNSVNKDVIEILIKLDYFSDYGNPNQLLKVYEIFTQWHNRKEISKEKCELPLEFILKYGNETAKKITKIDTDRLLRYLLEDTKNIKTRIRDRVRFEFEVSGYCYSKYPEYKDYALILDVNTENAPKITMYRLNGEEVLYKVYKKDFKKAPIKKFDFIQVKEIKSKPKQRYLGKDENGKAIYEPTDKNEYWMINYKII